MNIRNMPVGENFLAKNIYGQIFHFRLVRKHLNGAGMCFFYLQRLDLGLGEKAAHCYSERDMLEYTPA